jgi:hypothetical protein
MSIKSLHLAKLVFANHVQEQGMLPRHRSARQNSVSAA